MNFEHEWAAIRSQAARRLPADFSASVVREAARRRTVEARLRSALLTTAVLFVAVTAGAVWNASLADERRAAHAHYAWAQQRMGLDL